MRDSSHGESQSPTSAHNLRRKTGARENLHILVDAMSEVVRVSHGQKLVISGDPWRASYAKSYGLGVETGRGTSRPFGRDRRLKFIALKRLSACFPSSVTFEYSRTLEAWPPAPRAWWETGEELAEIVDHMSTGMKVPPNDPEAPARRHLPPAWRRQSSHALSSFLPGSWQGPSTLGTT